MKNNRAIVLAVFAAAWAGASFAARAAAADAPTDQVVAIYFHRTERCPTCQKMGSYAEEAVRTGFSKQNEDGSVVFHYVDFEDPKNARVAKGYGIGEPALVVAKIANNKVVTSTNLADIWLNVGDKPAFFKYVQDHIAACDAPDDRVVALYFHRTERCPTCQKLGAYAEEAVKNEFAKELKKGTVAFYYVDFQNPKYATLVSRYQIDEPALIVANIKAKKAVEFKNLEHIWAKGGDKADFFTYIQANVRQYLDR